VIEVESDIGYRPDGRRFTENFEMSIKIKSSDAKFDNLFGGNKVLSEYIYRVYLRICFTRHNRHNLASVDGRLHQPTS
jgi:hypothetical protein